LKYNVTIPKLFLTIQAIAKLFKKCVYFHSVTGRPFHQ